MNKLLIGCVTALAVGTGMAGMAAAADDGVALRLTVDQMDAITAGGSVFGGSVYTATATGIPLLGGLLPAYAQGESTTTATANAGGGQITTYAWAVAFGTNPTTTAASTKDPVSIGLTGGRTIALPFLSISYSWAGGQQVTIPVVTP